MTRVEAMERLVLRDIPKVAFLIELREEGVRVVELGPAPKHELVRLPLESSAKLRGLFRDDKERNVFIGAIKDWGNNHWMPDFVAVAEFSPTDVAKRAHFIS